MGSGDFVDGILRTAGVRVITVQRENLMVALQYAIRARKEQEIVYGTDFESALVAGWKEILVALQMEEQVEIS